MANWFTVHGPHPVEYDLAWDIYLQEQYKNLANEININDRVFFYELKGSGTLDGTVKLKVNRSNWWNEYIKPTLSRIPFSFRNHKPCSLAVSSILPQLSRY